MTDANRSDMQEHAIRGVVPKRVGIWIASAAAIIAALWPLSICAQNAERSADDATLFRFIRNPQRANYAPGNMGHVAFASTTTTNPGNLRYRENPASGAVLVELEHPDYSLHPLSADSESTVPEGYWQRLRSQIFVSADVGAMVDCRVTTALRDHLASRQQGFAEFADRFAVLVASDVPRPLLSIDLPDAEGPSVRQQFRRACPGLLTGKVWHEIPPRTANPRDHGYDFAIVDEEAIPETFRSQAAISFCRSRFGSIPIVIAARRPHFYRSLIWTATGAAGVQFQTLPGDDPDARDIAWKNLRAFSGFVYRLPAASRLAPELTGDHVRAGFSFGDAGYCLFLKRGQNDYRFEFKTPEVHPGYDAIGLWYNPVTDQNILLPQVPWAKRLTISPPSRAPWIYCGLAVPQLSDAATTTIAILPDPPEPLFDAQIPSQDEPATTGPQDAKSVVP